ncbi:MAG TPA: YbaK/EbsC family protein [Tepidisphaeraceae bacterium]|jgi:Ala-tRNA(Pro) deacylase
MATRRIQEFLDGNKVRYVLISHSPAYTASQVAESVHIPGRSLAKVVVVVVEGRLAMAVVPATCEVDMSRLQVVTGSAGVRLADEAEFAHRFEGCQVGAEPPFGNLFGMETYVEGTLANEPCITFNAGTHTDVIVMDFVDFQRLARPILARIDMAPVDTAFYVDQL